MGGRIDSRYVAVAERPWSVVGDLVRLYVLSVVVACITAYLCSGVASDTLASTIRSAIGLGGMGPGLFAYAALPVLAFGVILRLKPTLRDRPRRLANRCAALVFVQNTCAFGLIVLLLPR